MDIEKIRSSIYLLFIKLLMKDNFEIETTIWNKDFIEAIIVIAIKLDFKIGFIYIDENNIININIGSCIVKVSNVRKEFKYEYNELTNILKFEKTN